MIADPKYSASAACAKPFVGMLRIWQMSGQELAAIDMEKIFDVRGLKATLRSLHGFPMCMQQMLHNGTSFLRVLPPR